ncbi:MAG TPA: dynamin family protein, partial [Bacteroidia bacterium]|nr:dynamin family protein [Bacteroidia bacterium]
MKQEGIDDFLRSAASLLGRFEAHRDAADGLRQIAESSRQPFNLAVVGRMKAGKSTLINGLVGQSLAISDVEEATATLNWICHGTGDQLRSFVVHWRDGRSEPFPLGDLSQWTGKSEEVLARVRATLFLGLFDQNSAFLL